MHRPSSK